MVNINLPLKILLIGADGRKSEQPLLDAVHRVLSPQDELVVADAAVFNNSDWNKDINAVMVGNPCGSLVITHSIAAAGVPSMAISPPLAFHPYHAAFYRDMERMGGVVLPANDPDEIAASLQALRARKVLGTARLLLVNDHKDDFRANEIKVFAEGCRKHLGVTILQRPLSQLKERAAQFSDDDADRELERWYADIMEGPGEMTQEHMRQVAKLYLAERAMIDETGAIGITVDDIGGFLAVSEPEIMPNVSYGPLVFDGFLAAEECDIEVLTAELILKVSLGAHPTMSNIYLAYRDRFDVLDSYKGYTLDMELEDYRQCLNDNHVTVSHFSASGVLSPDMMVESHYKVREALPAWPGQSMIAATPKLGTMVMLRLTPDASEAHMVPGEADGLGFGDQYGWYRGRWFIKLPSVADFIARCQHQHYAIGLQNGRLKALEILLKKLLKLGVV